MFGQELFLFMTTKQFIRKIVIGRLLVLFTLGCVSSTAAAAGHTIPAVASYLPDSFLTGKIINPVICQSDPAQSYALYIPVKGNSTALPVIYFFDPHADGALPLSKYRSLADAYGFILIGSNNSKNGNDWTTTEKIWRHLWDDTQHRLKINGHRIYTCGFSGGAKVAGYVAINDPAIQGVIANGAGLPDEVSAGDFDFSFTAIAGEGDMNLTDLLAFSKALDKTRTRHHIILFDGKHEWAPENTMGLAFAGLQFDAMRKSSIPRDGALIDRYVAKSKKRLEADYQAGQLIEASRECSLSVGFLDGLAQEAAWFQKKAASLAGDPVFQKERREQEDLLVREQNIKEEYMQHFRQDDPGYWAATIKHLQIRAAAKTADRPMNQRLLAYLSLAFYSLSNRMIDGNDNSGARHFVELYKMADPTNSEAWYFSAILYARDNQPRAAENDLLKAVGYGFRDEQRMMHQPEFIHLSARMDLPAIKSRMHSSRGIHILN